MKKSLFIGAFFLALATTGFAQHSGISDRHPVETTKLLLGSPSKIKQVNKLFLTTGYFAPIVPKSERNKPTQMQSRLKNAFNQVYNGSGYTTLDSNIYFYSDLRVQTGADSIFLYSLGMPFFDVALYDPNDNNMPGLKFDSVRSYNIGGTISTEYVILDANGNTIKVLDKVDTGTGLQNFTQEDYTYDALSNMTSRFAQYWDGSSWMNNSAYLFAYNANGKMTGEIQLNGAGTSWDSVMKWVYTYDAQNNFTGQRTDVWNGSTSAWEPYSRFIEVLNNGNRMSEERQAWDSTQWISDFKDEFTYDANNHLASSTHHVWNGSAWQKTIRYNYTHDAAGHFTRQIYQGWSGTDWVDSIKQENVYNGNLMTEVNYSIWNTDSHAFRNVFQYAYTYNSYDQCTSVSSASNWDDSLFSPIADADFRYAFRYEEYDDGLGIGRNPVNPGFQMYPNPAHDEITVSVHQAAINRIRIVNLTGKVVFGSKAEMSAAKLTIPVGQLSDGIYFLQVQTGNQTGSRTLIVKH